ncbi:MAG: YcaQ family DNA glycosylase [Clostridia bacterium]|nr:YcaQ family DNA glycosylase [Clostridia bacterium]
MAIKTVSLAQARRFILRRQGLLGEYRYHGPAGVVAFTRDAGCVQYDPVDVCGRSPELTYLSRVEDYRSSMLEEALYKTRQLVDCYDKNLCILPVEDWPCFGRTRAWFSEAEHRSRAQVDEAAPRIRDLLRTHGPAFTDDLPDLGKVDWFWNSTSLSRATLETLYFRGELCVHHRDGARRAFDFTKNCLPEAICRAPDPHPGEDDHRDFLLERRIGAVGMLWNKRSDAHLGIPDFSTEHRNAAYARLERQGRILPFTIEGLKPAFYIRARDEALLDQCAADLFEPRTELIAPLDSFLWDRKQIEALFGFAYRWEIYTPAAKRQYGYYVLPVLQGEALVGRVECLRDRAQDTLRVNRYWKEPGTKLDRRAFRRALKRVAELNGVKRLEMNLQK